MARVPAPSRGPAGSAGRTARSGHGDGAVPAAGDEPLPVAHGRCLATRREPRQAHAAALAEEPRARRLAAVAAREGARPGGIRHGEPFQGGGQEILHRLGDALHGLHPGRLEPLDHLDRRDDGRAPGEGATAHLAGLPTVLLVLAELAAVHAPIVPAGRPG